MSREATFLSYHLRRPEHNTPHAWKIVSKVFLTRDLERHSPADLAARRLYLGTGQFLWPRSFGVNGRRPEGVLIGGVSYRDAETKGLEKKSSATGFLKTFISGPKEPKTYKMHTNNAYGD